MTASEIEQVLSGLRNDENGQWQVQLPDACTAFGQPIVLGLVTEALCRTPPPPDAAELDLCRRILANLTKVIDAAAASYLAYHGPEFPDAPAARSPRIEIWRETLRNEANQRWYFFFARDDWEDG